MNRTLTLLLAAALIMLVVTAGAQSNIIVEEVVFKGPGADCKIPHVKDKSNASPRASWQRVQIFRSN